MRLKARSRTVAWLAVALVGATGCVTARQHADQVREANGAERLDLGVVQREVRIGMSGADVIRALGSPNVVTTEAERREVWIYDRIATDTVRSSSTGLLLGVLIGGSAGAGGLGSASAGATSRTQRTLTVILYFDDQGRVRDFAYHASRF